MVYVAADMSSPGSLQKLIFKTLFINTLLIWHDLPWRHYLFIYLFVLLLFYYLLLSSPCSPFHPHLPPGTKLRNSIVLDKENI